MNLLELLDKEIYGNTLLTWGAALGVGLAAWLVLVLVRRVACARLRSLAERRRLVALEIAKHVVEQTRGWFLIVTALFLGARLPAWPDETERLLSRLAAIALLLQLGLWASAAVARFLAVRREQQLAEDPSAVAAMDVLGFVLRLAVWIIVGLVALDNLGVNITTLVAGLGVGGIAVALAAQNILGDLFASLSIVLDKPFVVGDFLNIDGLLGSVERVGLKTTRVRSLSGEQLIFANNDLLKSRIRNYGRMFQRRVVFSLGVVYQTPVAKLRLIPTICREAIEAHELTRFDRAHFRTYGDFALLFEIVYFIRSPDYNVYMDIQQEINLSIYERCEQEGIQFAYPTQTLYVSQTEAVGEPGRDGGATSAG